MSQDIPGYRALLCNVRLQPTDSFWYAADTSTMHSEAAAVAPVLALNASNSQDMHHSSLHQSVRTDDAPWSQSSRCYLPDLHAAECKVVSQLARMAATPQQQIRGGEQRIVNWLHKLQQEEGAEQLQQDVAFMTR